MKTRLPFTRLLLATAIFAVTGSGESFAQTSGTRVNKHVQTNANYIKKEQPALASGALPVNGQVVAGQATISQNGATMNVQQTTNRAVINWDSYNVGSNATVNYQQPNASSATLNRVTGATPSQINGAIRANGTVMISNSNGVTFGKGSQVDAASVVATTLNQSDQDFMNGSTTWSGNATGKVVNKGTITATGVNGYVALLASEVRNEGYVLATVGDKSAVTLASGQNITLNFNDNQLVGVSVNQAVVNGLIKNKRLVQVNGGLVVIAAG